MRRKVRLNSPWWTRRVERSEAGWEIRGWLGDPVLAAEVEAERDGQGWWDFLSRWRPSETAHHTAVEGLQKTSRRRDPSDFIYQRLYLVSPYPHPQGGPVYQSLIDQGGFQMIPPEKLRNRIPTEWKVLTCPLRANARYSRVEDATAHGNTRLTCVSRYLQAFQEEASVSPQQLSP